MANGYDLSITIRVSNLSGDDLADLYASDPAGTQNLIDQLTDSMRAANESTFDRLKTKGFQSFSIKTTMLTSDGMEIATAKNGVVTHSITQDNFRYG